MFLLAPSRDERHWVDLIYFSSYLALSSLKGDSPSGERAKDVGPLLVSLDFIFNARQDRLRGEASDLLAA